MSAPLHLYLHVPFCVRRCTFCNQKIYPATPETCKAYANALLAELEATAPDFSGDPVQTVYWGGGSPTALSQDDFARIMRRIRELFSLAADTEVTVEALPNRVDAVAQAQLLQRLHDAALEEDAAVLCIFQRLLGAELGVQRLDLPAALQSALVAALAHDVAVPAQGRAVEVGPEGQQMDAVAALEVVAGELGGGDEPHAVLHRVVVGVLGAEGGVVVRKSQSAQPQPRCHQGQAVDGDRAVRTGGMSMKVASHKLLSLDFYRFLCLVYHKNHRGTREPYTALPPTVSVEERMWWVRTTSVSSPPMASSSSTERVVEQRMVWKVMVSMPSARS